MDQAWESAFLEKAIEGTWDHIAVTAYATRMINDEVTRNVASSSWLMGVSINLIIILAGCSLGGMPPVQVRTQGPSGGCRGADRPSVAGWHPSSQRLGTILPHRAHGPIAPRRAPPRPAAPHLAAHRLASSRLIAPRCASPRRAAPRRSSPRRSSPNSTSPRDSLSRPCHLYHSPGFCSRRRRPSVSSCSASWLASVSRSR